MQDRFETTKLQPIQESGNEARDILMYVYEALQAKGYDPITQMVGYIISGDPTYITSYNSARSLICRLERDEILEELVRFYVKGQRPAQ
ncbi:MAG: IreB family regulatory phosphoprotein [Clostridia bacterium]|nr:IreB family regulatory phosphoprotein [Clostridia bacterium]MBR1686561.1 IreB family regulatory phosphoprotein [Clostridia bacterium]MBR2287060.1 IreB family regulatory phosphoprotein [Clostridia bacterium]